MGNNPQKSDNYYLLLLTTTYSLLTTTYYYVLLLTATYLVYYLLLLTRAWGGAQIEWASDGAMDCQIFLGMGRGNIGCPLGGDSGAILLRPKSKKTPLKLEGAQKGGKLPPPFGPSTTSPSVQIGG